MPTLSHLARRPPPSLLAAAVAGAAATAHRSPAALVTTSPLSSSSFSTSATPPPLPLPDPAPGIVEMRQYSLHPSGAADYLAATRESIAVRRKHLPLVAFLQPELGGDDLQQLTHFYSYPNGLDERAACRAAAMADPAWRAYVSSSRAHVRKQKNAALFEWPSLYEASGAPWRSAGEFASRFSSSSSSPPGIYELRTYRISPTASVRALVRAFEAGLPAKCAAARRELGGESGGGCDLALFGSAQIGALDTVVELWRYSSADACLRARVAARRGAPEWSRAVQSVAQGVSDFNVQLLNPVCGVSPMQ